MPAMSSPRGDRQGEEGLEGEGSGYSCGISGLHSKDSISDLIKEEKARG